jgi:hypothetical protein
MNTGSELDKNPTADGRWIDLHWVDKPWLTSNEAAKMLGVKAESMRVRLCKHGSYFGVVPVKHANGRLLWPSKELLALIANAKNAAR